MLDVADGLIAVTGDGQLYGLTFVRVSRISNSLMEALMEIKDYRQPMVTSIGVILGFLMGFLGQWVTEPTFELVSSADYMVFAGSLLGVVLLLAAMYRILSPVLPAEVTSYYQRTLQLYMSGIVVAFSSIVVSAFI